jgi:hypothetical protein
MGHFACQASKIPPTLLASLLLYETSHELGSGDIPATFNGLQGQSHASHTACSKSTDFYLRENA